MAKKGDCYCGCGFFPIVMLVALCAAPIALFVVGFTLALPYGYIRHFSEETVACTVTSVHERGLYSCNYCDEDYGACFSKYPCVEIVVEYVSPFNQSLVKNATLYHHPYSYTEDKTLQCSTSVCNQDVAENNRTVAEFVRTYGVIGRTFPCYPGMDSDPEALLSIIEHWKVLLGMLLPAAVLITAGIFQICYCVVYPIYRRR